MEVSQSQRNIGFYLVKRAERLTEIERTKRREHGGSLQIVS